MPTSFRETKESASASWPCASRKPSPAKPRPRRPNRIPAANGRACRQIASGTWPDFLVIEPEQEKANPQIKIDQVREIERHVIYRPLLSARKICVIDDADRLTANAANAFLKTLEDPPEHSLFILVTSQPLRLLATVRSRCLALRFSPATPGQFEGALALKQAMATEDVRFLSQLCRNRIGMALRTDLSELRSRHDQFFEFMPIRDPRPSHGRSATSRRTLENPTIPGRDRLALAWTA